jgi:hypothetical protein
MSGRSRLRLMRRHHTCRVRPRSRVLREARFQKDERRDPPATPPGMDVLNPSLGDTSGKCRDEQATAFDGVDCRSLLGYSLAQNANARTNALPDVLMNDVQILSPDPCSAFGDKPDDS